MTRRVLEHDRASYAHDAISRRCRDAKAWRKYRSIVLKLPVMVHNHGMAPALHFVAARADDSARAILDDLAGDLKADGILKGKGDRAALLAWTRGLNADDLRVQTREVLRRLGWYKRMAQAQGKEACAS